MQEKAPKATSRRSVIGWLVAVAIAPAMAVAGKALAQAKMKKDAAQYQDKPKDGKDCEGCSQFVPGKSEKAPGTCKVVEGSISPKGWCMVFAPKTGK